MTWTEAIREFYEPFSEDVEKPKPDAHIVQEWGPRSRLGVNARRMAGNWVIRYGRFGKFISCANFPTCRYTEPWLKRSA